MLPDEKDLAFAVAKEKIEAAIVATTRVPNGRATSLVLTKLDEAELWLRKSREEAEKKPTSS